MARYQKTINLDWKFFRGDDTDAWFKGMDDSGWKDVTLPHDWAVTEPFSRKHSSGGGYLSGGIGWYRTRFILPEDLKGKKVWITFDGIYNNAKVWVNSYYLGKRPYGYSTYSYDISHAASFGDNPTQVSVRVHHEHTADSRWFTGSGIYRKVSVTVKDPVYIQENGVFFTTPEADNDTAAFRIENTLVNETGSPVKAILRNSLICDSGKTVACVESAVELMCGENALAQEGTVTEPRLWSPENPSLYTLKTELFTGETLRDNQTIRVGIRTFCFHPDEGFFLNGKSEKFLGVCVHHDAGCLGAAVTKKVWKRRLDYLKECGCNAIRMSHNPHMPELYELCDEMGFFVMDEAFDEWEGPKNKWSTGHNVYPPKLYGYFEDFPKWHEDDLRSMVLRDRNHPSVILWSIGNEIDYPNDPYCHPYFAETTGNNDSNKPANERKYSPDKPNAERVVTLAKKLKAIVKKYDTTRPVTAAVSFPELSNITGFCDVLDVCGYNHKDPLLTQDYPKYPGRCYVSSETNSSYPSWCLVRDNDFVTGQFLWTGIDFLGETIGWPYHGSSAGLMDLAGYPKAGYYFRRSLWQKKPVAQLVASRPLPPDIPRFYRRVADTLSWNFAPGEEINVSLFTNCLTADITLNGAPVGSFKLADFAEEGYISCKVPFQPGVLEAVAIAEDGTRVITRLETAGAPAAITAKVYDECFHADGEDIAQIEVTVVDNQGRPALSCQDIITVKVEGAELLGLENGDLSDNTDYTASFRRANHGRLLAYIRAPRTPSTVKVRFNSMSLKPLEVDLEAK